MITVENTKNGEVVSSHKTADKGDTITLTATPDKGYAIRRIIVTDSSDQKLTLTEKDGKYTFTMPSSNVTVKTTFIMDKSKDEVPNPFADVSANSYYYDAVQWAVKNGITGGTSATTFSPDAPCTRAQAVTFLWRAAGSPAPSSTEMPFADVPTDAYYYNAVLWAVEKRHYRRHIHYNLLPRCSLLPRTDCCLSVAQQTVPYGCGRKSVYGCECSGLLP